MDFFNTWIEKGIIQRLSVLSSTYCSYFSFFFYRWPVWCLISLHCFPNFVYRLSLNWYLYLVGTLTLFCCWQDVVEKEFVQLTYSDAIEILLEAKKKFEFPVCTFPYTVSLECSACDIWYGSNHEFFLYDWNYIYIYFSLVINGSRFNAHNRQHILIQNV